MFNYPPYLLYIITYLYVFVFIVVMNFSLTEYLDSENKGLNNKAMFVHIPICTHLHDNIASEVGKFL